jgi:hypothetical protein
MKIKFLAILGLSAALGAVGCKSAANTNTATMNANMTSTTTTTATTMPTMAPAMDTATKATVESAITKAGITGVMVDATTAEITLRGSVADKAKMAQAVQIANEKGGGKKVVNQLVATK